MKHGSLGHVWFSCGIASALCQLGCSDAGGEAAHDVQSVASPLTRYQSTNLWPQGDIPVCWEGVPWEYTAEKQLVQAAVVDSWGKHSALNFPSSFGTMWPDCTPTAPGIHLTPSNTNNVASLGIQNGKSYVSLDFRATPSYPGMLGSVCQGAGWRDFCIGWAARREFGHALGFGDPEEAFGDPQNCSPGSSHAGNTSWGVQNAPSSMSLCSGTIEFGFNDFDIGGLVRIYGPERGAPILHSGGRCVQPSTGQATPADGIAAVLGNTCSLTRAALPIELTAAGRLRQTSSGKCLQPVNSPPADTTLVYRSDCSSPATEFRAEADGRLRHVASNFCVQPLGGGANPASGTALVLNSNCALPDLRFRPLLANPFVSNDLRLTHRSGLFVRPLRPPAGSGTTEPRATLSGDYSTEKYELLPSGSLRYFDGATSQWLCMIPATLDQPVVNNTRLIHTPYCDTWATMFEFTWGGSVRHRLSGKCIHPAGGSANPAHGTELVLHDNCDYEQLRFANTAQYR